MSLAKFLFGTLREKSAMLYFEPKQASLLCHPTHDQYPGMSQTSRNCNSATSPPTRNSGGSPTRNSGGSLHTRNSLVDYLLVTLILLVTLLDHLSTRNCDVSPPTHNLQIGWIMPHRFTPMKTSNGEGVRAVLDQIGVV